MMSGRLSTVAGRGLAIVIGCLAIVGTSVATGHGSLGAAVESTHSVIVATALAENAVVIAGGGLLVGLGISIIVSSVLTYKYKNKQIRSRLS